MSLVLIILEFSVGQGAETAALLVLRKKPGDLGDVEDVGKV
jgi:hypothetical protein